MSNHHRFRAFLPRRLALSLLWPAVTGAILSMGAGCELIANVDRSQISDTTTTTAGTGGAGGHGGATGTGGMAGHGGSTTTGTGGQGGGPECTKAEDCPGNDTECQTRTCTDSKCGFDFQAMGKVVNDQQAGDCKLNICDGNGGLTTKDDDGDILDDKNPCTDDSCAAGTPKNLPSTSGVPCTDPNNADAKLCDGAGTCVECLVGGDCTSGVCEPMDGSCVPPTCMDGVKNGVETDTDCGGGTCGTCEDGLACGVAADCASSVCTGSVCQAPTCADTTENGDETDVDCGGSCAPAQKCGPDKKCSVNADCAGDECSGAICVPNCADSVKNGTESDTDCGGATCQKCVPGKVCSVAADCAEGVCNQDVCANPTCSDTVKNGGETDADCGGPCAPAKKCGDGKGCGGPDDCQSSVCTNDTCQPPSCSDGVKNGLEGGLDCGAVCPMLCADGISCLGAGDCVSGVCTNGVCQVAGCGDGVQNGTETGVDCGGSCAPAQKCADGLGCGGGGDCQSGVCSANVCQIPTCNDATKNGTETDTDCGGSCATKCADGKICGVAADCQSGVCTNGVCAAPSCGDGVKNGAEGCDDGNGAAGDGCTACAVDAGYACNSAVPNVCAPVCGDNQIVGGETCDDGNQVSGDCCSSSCQIEAGCEVEPNNTAPTANTIVFAAGVGQVKGSIKPLADTDYFKFTLGATSDVAIQTFDGSGANTCTGAGDHDTVVTLYGPDGTTQLANNDEGGAGITPCSKIDPASLAGARQLAAGTYFVKVIRYNNSQVIPLYRLAITVLTTCGDGTKAGFEGCDDTNQASNDGCTDKCVVEPGYTCAGTTPSVCTLTCGNGVLDAGETCDQGGGNHASGDGCSNACIVEAGYTCAGTPSVCTPNCGNGVLDAGEQCDQGGGNQANGDGCSSTCQREPDYQCTGLPSVCFPFETTCGDGMDNDGDGQVDLVDDDCVVTVNFPPCAAGQIRKVFRSSDTPLAIPDNNATGATSVINVAGAGAAARSSIVYAITHTFDGDVDMFLTPPGGAAIDVCTDNGGGGDNFIGTVLDNTCSTTLSAGAAPFTGCFKPENNITTTADGAWSLKVADDATGDTGTLQGWAVILCTTVTCGNGMLDAGETCDDNNQAGGDGCSASCQTEAGYTCAGTPSVCTPNCGNGALDAGEQCDQGGGVQGSGDGCSATCQLEANFKCTGAPSVCVPFETSCSDGMDNDGDGQVDDADDDCIVTLAFPSCAAGETRLVFRSTDTPLAIPDDDPLGMFSTIEVTGAGTVTRAAIVYNITHTFDSDLDIYVTPSGGALTDVCTGNGGSGDNFVKTVLDNTCATNVTAGAAPFTGCFKPENQIAAVGDGTWELDIADGFSGDIGTLQSWAVVLCSTP